MISLETIEVFRNSPPDIRSKLVEAFREEEVKKGTILFSPAHSNDFVYLLKSGEVQLSYKHYTKDLLIEAIQPGILFGKLDEQETKPSYEAVATEDSIAWKISSEEFWKLVKQSPELMLTMINFLHDRLRHYEEKIKSLVFDAKEKILHHLEILEGRKHRYMKMFLVGTIMSRMARVTHEKLAQYTGLTRETVTRAINDLKKEEKIIITPDGKIMLNCEDCVEKKQ